MIKPKIKVHCIRVGYSGTVRGAFLSLNWFGKIYHPESISDGFFLVEKLLGLL